MKTTMATPTMRNIFPIEADFARGALAAACESAAGADSRGRVAVIVCIVYFSGQAPSLLTARARRTRRPRGSEVSQAPEGPRERRSRLYFTSNTTLTRESTALFST